MFLFVHFICVSSKIYVFLRPVCYRRVTDLYSSKRKLYYKYFNMKLKIVVLAKQVPDTRNVGKDAMTAEGTVNRAALPAIFNPEDLNALEQALRIKDQNPGSTVTMLTMGPPRAGEIIRQGLYRGADDGILLTDRKSAGADTLATSYFLAKAIEKIDKEIGHVDIVLGGRQAIDGDTAQVGPQVAQKLGLNQVTYAEEVQKIEDGKATILRHIDGGVETVEAPLPVVITVNGSAAPARPCNAKNVMKYKYATCPMERKGDEPWTELYETRPYLTLGQWSIADCNADYEQCGLAGSPTKVSSVKSIVFQAKESQTLTASDADIEGLVTELLDKNIIG
jgi:electron transfer flavoprotein beta subunit